nr:hypothetical protein [Tanacetum cinerariifolium]
MAQQIIPNTQVVHKFQGIRRCNNYVVLQSIPCSQECKIVGQILLDHPLNYALTATADVPVVYLQQFWKTVSKVPDTKDSIRFKLDIQYIMYTVDMFHDTLHLPVETPDNPFITPVTIKTIESFIQTIGYQGIVDKYPSIPQRLDKDYHSIKDDIPLEYKRVFFRVEVLMNQPQSVVSTQGTHRITPRAYRIPTITAASPQGKKRKQSVGETKRDKIVEATLLILALHKAAIVAEAQENVAKVKEKLAEEEIEKMVEEPRSHKENSEVVGNDVNDTQKQEESKNDNAEKTGDDAEEKDNDDHTDQKLVKTDATVSTWEDLVEKFIQKFYQLSYDNKEIEAKEDDEPDDIIDIFKIKGNLFDYETPLCKAFNDFNYLFKIDTDLFTFDIQVIRTYEEYELNNTMTKDLEEPWLDNGVPYQLCDHICEPYHFKNEITKRPMYSSDIDGFSNGGELPGMVRVTSMTYFQDHKWGHEERRDDPTHELSVCKIRRFEMRNYSFNADEEYIIIKESEYVNHSKDNLEAYQELLRIIDEGWVVEILKDKLIKSGKEKVELNNWLKQKCFLRDNLVVFELFVAFLIVFMSLSSQTLHTAYRTPLDMANHTAHPWVWDTTY